LIQKQVLEFVLSFSFRLTGAMHQASKFIFQSRLTETRQMQITKVLLSLTLALVVSVTCFAQDNDKKAKKANERAVKNTTTQMMKFFAKANLTDEQKEKATAVIEKHVADLIAARKAQDSMLTAVQKKARTEAIAKAKKDGAKGGKIAAVGTKAMGLSEEEMKKYTAAKKKVNDINMKMRETIMAMLTDEQKAAMPKRGGGKKGAKGAKKGGIKGGKKDKKKADDGGNA
jgi:hypothetical protein